MELMFIALAGVIIGLAGRYLLPWRETHGTALLPAVGGIAAMVLWVGLTWAGLKWDAGVIWWIALFGTGAVVAATGLLVGQLRMRSDALLLQRISQQGARSAA
jgi:quaternary ammonium compound-resistance protein SugE